MLPFINKALLKLVENGILKVRFGFLWPMSVANKSLNKSTYVFNKKPKNLTGVIAIKNIKKLLCTFAFELCDRLFCETCAK